MQICPIFAGPITYSVLMSVVNMLDASPSPPPVMGQASTEYRSKGQLNDVIEDEIIMKRKKRQSGTIVEGQVIDNKELPISVAQRTYLHITGMSCTSCVNNIETNMIKKLGKRPTFVVAMPWHYWLLCRCI